MNKILYYNVYLVSELIRRDKRYVLPFLSEQYDDKVFQNYEKFGLNKHNAIYDRTSVLPHFLNMSNVNPMPGKIENYTESFYNVTEARCKELLSRNKPIVIMWSGGIDSTYAMFMLHHFANDKSQIKVCGTYNSILESGDMFDRTVKHLFEYSISESSGVDFKYQEDCIYVNGMGGNQLFGPTDNMFGNNNLALFHHTLGTPETIYEQYQTNIDPELLEFFAPMIAASPKKIETVADLRWYCIFNLDWNTALYDHKILLDIDRAQKIVSFFDTTEFQSWAINTKEPFTKIKGDPNTHRWQMREILSDMFGEYHYAKHKTKVISNLSMFDPNWLFLLENGHNVVV